MTVTGNAFVTRATLINDIDSKSHKMELKKAEGIKLIIQHQNHTTSYLWPRDLHTHAHIHTYSIAQKFGWGKSTKLTNGQ